MQLHRLTSPPAPGNATPASPLADASASAQTTHGNAPGQWSSHQLFGSRQEVQIAHGDSVYRLRITALGKLILTK